MCLEWEDEQRRTDRDQEGKIDTRTLWPVRKWTLIIGAFKREIKIQVQICLLEVRKDVSCSLYRILDFNFKGAHAHRHTHACASPRGYNSRRSKGQKLFVFQAREASWRKSADCSKSQNGQKDPRVEWRHFQRLPLSLSLLLPNTHTHTHARGDSHSRMTACQNCVFTARREM